MQADQINAMKSGDKQKVETLRFILAQIKNKEIDKKTELTDEETVGILRKQVKELQESIDAFKTGGRTDLVAQSEAQKNIARSYLPAEMSDEELKSMVQRILEANKELIARDPKAIIGVCMKELRSKADPSRIMKIINTLTSH